VTHWTAFVGVVGVLVTLLLALTRSSAALVRQSAAGPGDIEAGAGRDYFEKQANRVDEPVDDAVPVEGGTLDEQGRLRRGADRRGRGDGRRDRAGRQHGRGDGRQNHGGRQNGDDDSVRPRGPGRRSRPKDTASGPFASDTTADSLADKDSVRRVGEETDRFVVDPGNGDQTSSPDGSPDSPSGSDRERSRSKDETPHGDGSNAESDDESLPSMEELSGMAPDEIARRRREQAGDRTGPDDRWSDTNRSSDRWRDDPTTSDRWNDDARTDDFWSKDDEDSDVDVEPNQPNADDGDDGGGGLPGNRFGGETADRSEREESEREESKREESEREESGSEIADQPWGRDDGWAEADTLGGDESALDSTVGDDTWTPPEAQADSGGLGSVIGPSDPYGFEPPLPDEQRPGIRVGESELSTRTLLLNVVGSQLLFAGLLVGAAWWTGVPAESLGVVPLWDTMAVLLGVGLGVGLWIASELGGRVGQRFGVGPSEELREALAPTTRGEWALLLGVVLPVVALFEEFLFRSVLVGGLGTGFDVPIWALVVGSSLVFGLAHSAQGALGIVVTGVLGAVLAVAFVLTDSFLAVVVAHYLVNALEFLVHESPLGTLLGPRRV
jgi:membrane protease YdiL (CAAX protease family)